MNDNDMLSQDDFSAQDFLVVATSSLLIVHGTDEDVSIRRPTLVSLVPTEYRTINLKRTGKGILSHHCNFQTL